MPVTDCVVAEGVVVTHPELVNLYGCRIGAETRIGPFVEIQRGSTIGSRAARYPPTPSSAQGSLIEDEVFVGHGVMFTNELLPSATNDDGTLQRDGDWECTPTIVQRGASIGSNATIICGVDHRMQRPWSGRVQW